MLTFIDVRIDTVDVGAWVRVSSGGQDEENQVPDIENYCAAHDYRITKRYVLNDKSASKGEQQAKLDEAITDMRLGVIKVLVCWHSDRLERRGPEHLLRDLRQAEEAGGRIESVREPLLGARDLSGEVMTTIGAIIAHQYSVHLAEQVKLAHDRIRANNGLTPGGIPWGYVVTGPKYAKTIVPTEQCKKYVPQIFQRCIDGQSCMTIAKWLDSEDVKPPRGKVWSDRTLWQLLQNMTYAGRRQNEGDPRADGSPSRKNRRTVMTCEAVMSMETFQRAQKALHKRPVRGPGVNTPITKPLLVGLKCAQCASRGIDSPMYRIKKYYRCFGRQPRRKSCGNMIPMEQIDTIVMTRFLVWHDKPYEVETWVEGMNWDNDIERIKQDLREIDPINVLDDPEVAQRQADLMAELADYRSRPIVEGHMEKEATSMTRGEYFYDLSPEGKREYLKTFSIAAEKVTDDSGHVGARLVIDGEDHGVFLYPPTRELRRQKQSTD